MISTKGWYISKWSLINLSLLAQIFNATFWNCFKLGGVILVTSGFFQWSYIIDFMSGRFLIFCTFIGFLVVVYSNYYITPREIGLFRGVIFLFIIAMLLLTSSSNIITIFIGWEGVGIVSFVLIGWFLRREKAASASYFAFIFNRFADFFFLVLILWEVRGELRLFFPLVKGDSYFNYIRVNQELSVIFLVCFWVATAAKSAQAAFHPWLTLAMEGPTPVRRLLHRSTIVVAGVFLLLKVHPLIISSGWIKLNNIIALSSAITLVLTSIWALAQRDIKKIIALSTTRQLRFMILVCVIGQHDLAFMHLIIHGLFKALLFLGSGINIHNNITHNQSFIASNILVKDSTFLRITFILGILGLGGGPFIGAFYRKHLILEIPQHYFPILMISSDPCGSITLHTLSVIVLYLAPILTLAYSMKLISFISLGASLPLISSTYLAGYLHEDWKVVVPLGVLALSTLIIGSLFRNILRGGVTTIMSMEDWSHSPFLLAGLFGWLFYIFYAYSSSAYIYYLSDSWIKMNSLYLFKILETILYKSIEIGIIKKELKQIIPVYKTQISLRVSTNTTSPKLKYWLIIFTYTLIIRIIFLIFSSAFFF